MAKIKFQDLKKMSNEERKTKLGELKVELIKARAGTSKTGNSKPKEIKKIIARLLSINKKTEKQQGEQKNGNMS